MIVLRRDRRLVPPAEVCVGWLVPAFVMRADGRDQVPYVTFQDNRILRKVFIPGSSYVAGYAWPAFNQRANSYRCCGVLRAPRFASCGLWGERLRRPWASRPAFFSIVTGCFGAGVLGGETGLHGNRVGHLALHAWRRFRWVRG